MFQFHIFVEAKKLRNIYNFACFGTLRQNTINKDNFS